MADRVYCTYFDHNYLSRGVALHRSLQRHAPGARLWVCCEDREGFRRHLDGCGVSSDIHYPIPDHLQPGYNGGNQGRLPGTERLAGQVVTLPCFAELTEEEVRQVIQAVNSW